MKGLHKYESWGFRGVENSYSGFLSYDFMQPGSWVPTFWRNILPEYNMVPTSTKLQDATTQKTTMWRSVQNSQDSQNLGGNQKFVTSVVNFCLNCHLVLEELPDISKELTASTFKHFQLQNQVELKFWKCLLV
jgi:hypothetical protein